MNKRKKPAVEDLRTMTIHLAPDVREMWGRLINDFPLVNRSALINEMMRFAVPAMDRANRKHDLSAEIRRALEGLQAAAGGISEGEALRMAAKSSGSVGQFVGYSQPAKAPKAKAPGRSTPLRRNRGEAK